MSDAGDRTPDRRLMPPVWFLLALLAMVALRVVLPVAHWSWWPWNLVGLAPMLAGLVLNVVADGQFKRHRTTIRPFERSSALVTGGLFGLSRNPMYLGMACFLLGLAICLSSATPFLVIPVFVWWITTRFIVPEERGLTGQFGQDYAAYLSRVRRWI